MGCARGQLHSWDDDSREECWKSRMARRVAAGHSVDCLVLTKRWSLVRHPTGCCGHFGELRVRTRPERQAELPYSPVSCEGLRATSPKSQPPHLVYGYIYCHFQNLSSDHLLSGVVRE